MKTTLQQSLKSYGIILFCLILSVIGFIRDWDTFQPGFISPDTLDQYKQALSHKFTDWHPPIMSFLWSFLLHIKNGPQPMLFMQLFLLWSSFFILLRFLIINYIYLSFLAVLFVLAPFVQNFAGNIWKDVHMGLSWLFACMIMIQAFYQKRKMNFGEAFLSLLFISYGCWLRTNALPGAIPLCSLWLVATFNIQVKGWKSFLILCAKTIAVTGVIILFQAGVTKFIIKPQKNYIEYKLFLQDLSGIYVETGDMLFPEFVTSYPEFDTSYLRKHYAYYTFDQFFWNEDNKFIFPNVGTNIAIIRNSWLKAIAEHPGAYLKIKWKGFLDFLRITKSGTELCIIFPYVPSNDFGFSYTPNENGVHFIERIQAEKNSFYMQPWFWALFNLILIGISFLSPLRKIKVVLLSLLLSSFFYLALEFFVFPADTEFRYFYWNCLAISLSFILVVCELTMFLFQFIHSRKSFLGDYLSFKKENTQKS